MSSAVSWLRLLGMWLRMSVLACLMKRPGRFSDGARGGDGDASSFDGAAYEAEGEVEEGNGGLVIDCAGSFRTEVIRMMSRFTECWCCEERTACGSSVFVEPVSGVLYLRLMTKLSLRLSAGWAAVVSSPWASKACMALVIAAIAPG